MLLNEHPLLFLGESLKRDIDDAVTLIAKTTNNIPQEILLGRLSKFQAPTTGPQKLINNLNIANALKTPIVYGAEAFKIAAAAGKNMHYLKSVYYYA